MREDIAARLQHIRLLILDCDGVLSDGRVWVGPEGQEWLAFDRRDGEGIRRVLASGITVQFVSHELCPAMLKRAQKLGVSLHLGVQDKAETIRTIMRVSSHGPLTPAEVAYMGDDEPDVEAMALVGLAIAPADAHPAAQLAAHWITKARGGRGAVREVCDLLISARAGHDSG